MDHESRDLEALQTSAEGGGGRSAARAPWIVAGSILAAACIVSFTLVSLHGDGRPVTVAAQPDAASSADQAFIGAQVRAQDRAAQSDLRNALVAAKTIWTDHQSYSSADASPTGLYAVEPSLCYVDAETESAMGETECSDPPISVYASNDVWAAARMSNSGTCYWIRDDSVSGTTYGEGGPCTGAAATLAASGSWLSSGTDAGD